MSRLDESGHDEQRLLQYLLGLLPPRDAERLDEVSLVDDDTAARLRSVEDDLVDSYVRGTLAGETLRRFESHYLSSPLRRRTVARAGRFVRAVDRAVGPDGAAAGRGSGRWTLLSTLGVAAALLLAAGDALLLQAA